MKSDKEYLWLNLSDLADLGKVGGLASPIHFMVRDGLGDEKVGVYTGHTKADEIYMILKSSAERLTAIREAMEMIGKKKIGRKIRTRSTKNPPRANWRWVGSW